MGLLERSLRDYGAVVLGLGIVLLLCPALSAQQFVMTWGMNTPEWNKALGVNSVRLGCSDPPSSCVRSSERIAHSQGVDRIFLTIRLQTDRALAYVREYSRLSASHPMLYEIGIDDFVGQAERLKMSSPVLSRFLAEVTRGAKSENPKLQFGITLYMDDLTSKNFQLADLSDEFRGSIDFVHLYPHFRRETQTFEEAARQAEMIFPRARIIAGLYAYDRRDYFPCARGNREPCSNEDEIEGFRQTLENRTMLFRNGQIAGLEFYPGNFGMEKDWGGWRSPRACRSDRFDECVENTKQMREMVRQALQLRTHR